MTTVSLVVFVGCLFSVLWSLGDTLNVFIGNDTTERVAIQVESRDIECLDQRFEIVNRVGDAVQI